ncbi:pyridoxamine 5'-phosphate oxidase family protein [Salipiger abyssi]|uniref:pyridoxamine 5'-phosphate oxidase family protein n=1 Tax=Salipiger abyssi TaxID=1250539 RepID=UPI001A8D2A16|nr:pyridoxamine 5'-phosphate oxidase family protein [Salipiger abyssi]MBN9885795.1 pyridoxamine 5'-phosphate oxidase family protein [Salipiger abyssi]
MADVSAGDRLALDDQFFGLDSRAIAPDRSRRRRCCVRPAPDASGDRQGIVGLPGFHRQRALQRLGDIKASPQIGMLFMDFERRRRARVNGTAGIVAADGEIRDSLPMAQAAVRVSVEPPPQASGR